MYSAHSGGGGGGRVLLVVLPVTTNDRRREAINLVNESDSGSGYPFTTNKFSSPPRREEVG